MYIYGGDSCQTNRKDMISVDFQEEEITFYSGIVETFYQKAYGGIMGNCLVGLEEDCYQGVSFGSEYFYININEV